MLNTKVACQIWDQISWDIVENDLMGKTIITENETSRSQRLDYCASLLCSILQQCGADGLSAAMSTHSGSVSSQMCQLLIFDRKYSSLMDGTGIGLLW